MRTSELRPVLLVVSELEPNEDIGKAIGSCIDENGDVRASASPELESARHKLTSLEGGWALPHALLVLSFCLAVHLMPCWCSAFA